MTTLWNSFRLKYLVKPIAEKMNLDEGSAYIGLDAIAPWTGKIDLSLANTNKESEGNRFYSGDILFGKMGPHLAKVTIPNFSGHCTSEALVLRPRDDLDARFLRYQLVNTTTIDLISSSTYGATMPRTSWNFMGCLRFKIPDIVVQKDIADFLDYETTRINHLIEKKEHILSLISSRIEALIDQAISDKNVPRIRFENLVNRMQRSVTLSDHDEIVCLGLYNRGRGIFKKTAVNKEEIGDSNFFYVKEGDLIISGQFAWEGAVALATQEEEGCAVSHRYPVYRGRSGVNTGYLLGFLRSSLGDFILNEVSRGSAGRNRPLNTWCLGKKKIPVPSINLQEEVNEAINFEYLLRKKTKKSIALLKEFRASIINEAVTGRLNIHKGGIQ